MNENVRKKSKWAVISQKMMSFRVDLDVLEKLQEEPNKGRLINNLLREHYGLPDEDGRADGRAAAGGDTKQE